MATVPFRDSGDARGEMERIFAEMPGAPSALVLMVATRGRLGHVGPRDNPSHAADEATGAPGAPGTPHSPTAGPVLPRDQRAGQVGGATSARTEDPHERRRTGIDPRSTVSKRWHSWQSPPINKEEVMSTNSQDGSSRPTVVLVHGAFAESASWDGVIGILQKQGYTAIAAPNPLRSLSGDAEAVAGILDSIEGPIVLVGHSYGGSVISNAALGRENVRAMVFVAAFAPEEGESIGELSGLYPGSTLGNTLMAVPLSDGTTDLYIRQEQYHGQFAADVPAGQATLMAATQRPLRDVALNEGSGPPAWRDVPSWFVVPGLDKNIPPEAQRFMADRAEAREILEIEGASHAVPASRADEVAEVIFAAMAHVEQLARNQAAR